MIIETYNKDKEINQEALKKANKLTRYEIPLKNNKIEGIRLIFNFHDRVKYSSGEFIDKKRNVFCMPISTNLDKWHGTIALDGLPNPNNLDLKKIQEILFGSPDYVCGMPKGKSYIQKAVKKILAIDNAIKNEDYYIKFEAKNLPYYGREVVYIAAFSIKNNRLEEKLIEPR